VIPVTLGIVLFSAVLLAGAAIGALAAGVVRGRGGTGYGRLIHSRRSCSVAVTSGFSRMMSRIVLTAEVRSPAFQDLARATGEGPEQKAPARLRLPH
jgi:hypothetical protein